MFCIVEQVACAGGRLGWVVLLHVGETQRQVELERGRKYTIQSMKVEKQILQNTEKVQITT